MTNTLLHYFEQRFEKSKVVSSAPGPFITISRETGCNGSGIAADLVKTLRAKNKSWRFINKEILEESANQLKVDQSKIHYVFESRKRTHMDDVISALSSRYYKSDKVVRKTITEVLRHYAGKGHVIIVGRAGVATTSGLPNGLHLRLTAPYHWRVNSLKERKEFANIDVEEFVKNHDLKKKKLIEVFTDRNITEVQFDLNINCASFTRAQLVSLIIRAMELKNLAS